MQSLSKKYKNTVVFANLIQPNLVSVHAQLDVKGTARNLFEERIYKTSNLAGALEYYIQNYLLTKTS